MSLSERSAITERNLRVWFQTEMAPGSERAWLDTKLPGYRATLRVSVTGERRLILQVYKRIKGGRPLRRNLLDWRDDRTLTGQEATARKLAGEILGQVNQGVDLTEQARKQKQAAEQQRAHGTSLRTAVADYLKNPHGRLKESTIKTGQRAVNQMERHAGAAGVALLDSAIVDIKLADVRAVHTAHSAVSPAAADGAMRILSASVSAWISALIEDDEDAVVPRNPIRLALAKTAGRDSHWNKVAARDVHVEDERLGFWWDATSTLPADVRGVLRIMLLSGLRVGEATGLKWENIDLVAGTLKVCATKNGKDHTLPITDGIRETLPIRPRSGTGKVFPLATESRLRKAHDHIEAVIGKRVTNHDLRRSFATVANRLGISIYTLKVLLNHSSNDRDVTGTHYAKVAPADLRAALAKIEAHIKQHTRLSAENVAPLEPVKLTVVA